MAQEEKELLLKDLCARLPYGVKIWYKYATWQEPWFCISVNIAEETLWLGHKINKSDLKVSIIDADEILIKPYLRPMSSMTEEEKEEYHNLCYEEERECYEFGEWTTRIYFHDTIDSIDWLNAHHFDYRGLIKMGLALEAPEGMYEKGGSK